MHQSSSVSPRPSVLHGDWYVRSTNVSIQYCIAIFDDCSREFIVTAQSLALLVGSGFFFLVHVLSLLNIK
jgi:hypothetical protein